MIGLRAIDRNNWEQCIHLKPAQEQQRFIASNLYSIAESQSSGRGSSVEFTYAKGQKWLVGRYVDSKVQDWQVDVTVLF